MTQISSPSDRQKIKKLLSEVSDSMTRIAAERDLIKETIKEMSLFPEEAVVAKITDVFQVQNAKDVFQMAAHLTLPNMVPDRNLFNDE